MSKRACLSPEEARDAVVKKQVIPFLFMYLHEWSESDWILFYSLMKDADLLYPFVKLLLTAAGSGIAAAVDLSRSERLWKNLMFQEYPLLYELWDQEVPFFLSDVDQPVMGAWKRYYLWTTFVSRSLFHQVQGENEPFTKKSRDAIRPNKSDMPFVLRMHPYLGTTMANRGMSIFLDITFLRFRFPAPVSKITTWAGLVQFLGDLRKANLPSFRGLPYERTKALFQILLAKPWSSVFADAPRSDDQVIRLGGQCAYCGRENPLKECSCDQRVYYCDRSCQMDHFDEHSLVCTFLN